MKKTISLLLAAMMMLGSLCVFAEDGLMPLIDCDHQYGRHEGTPTYIDIDRCTTKRVVNIYCAECGRQIDSKATFSYHHTWVDEIIDGDSVKACYYCGKVQE